LILSGTLDSDYFQENSIQLNNATLPSNNELFIYASDSIVIENTEISLGTQFNAIIDDCEN